MESSIQDQQRLIQTYSHVFFGLTNSLATFQTMMDAIFRNEIASGDVIIYMDDILIATNGSLERHKAKVTHIL